MQIDEGPRIQPAFWNDPAFNHPAQPVVGVSWYEARAYCAWLAAQTGDAYRLPTEAEWEAAARGRPRRGLFRSRPPRRYAWGDDFDAACCNAFETHERATTPIGVFSSGDTPEGLADMTGNAWDWTSSLYRHYPYVASEAPYLRADFRVVRGGSWFSGHLTCRGACRDHGNPGSRSDYVGFRVCCAPPIN
jgi:formylglycine-generating enzyme required for sulfatase activity